MDYEAISDEKVTLVVKELGEALIARRDVKATQTDGGEWLPVRKNPKDPSSDFMPFTMMDFKAHLSGDYSLGHYLLAKDNQTKMFAFDIDVVAPKPDEELPPYRDIWLAGGSENPNVYKVIQTELAAVAMALGLAIEAIFENEVRVAVMDSGGKGLHVYGLTGLQPAFVQRQLAEGVLEELTMDDGSAFAPTRGNNFWRWNDTTGDGSYSSVEIEVFPKQDELQEGGLGNLLALPLGVNRKTGRRRHFVTLTGDDTNPWVPIDPHEALTVVRAWRQQ